MESDRIIKKYKSSRHYLLASLVPYSEANLKLTFSLKAFLSDVGRLDNYKEQTLRNEYYKLVKDGLVIMDEGTGQPIVTELGLVKLKPYRPKSMPKSCLMVIFDIPENSRYKRRQLRTLLRQLYFIQVQKSVWVTNKDSREYLKSEIKRLDLADHVQVFESVRLK